MKIEKVQKDGITPSERIIRFFEKGVSREIAEELYDKADEMGLKGGTDIFDKAVILICETLGLNSDELIQEFKDN